MKLRYVIAALLCFAGAPAMAEPVNLEDMTWLEVQARMKAGATTVIIPTGGTEQNGPHIAIGKHNVIVAKTAEGIAEKLGDALVAPVLAYVPEGRISPPEGHMKFPGTISVSDETFAAVLEDAARSFKQHGFTLIAFIGDHGGNQGPQAKVAEKLNDEWRASGVRALHVSDYYKNNGQGAWASKQGIKATDPAAHAGFFDTAEMLAAQPEGVRAELIQAYGPEYFATAGVAGDPREATKKFGETLLSLKINAAVKQIRDAKSRR